jgi:hypothetical protein
MQPGQAEQPNTSATGQATVRDKGSAACKRKAGGQVGQLVQYMVSVKYNSQGSSKLHHLLTASNSACYVI